jgi:SAM-dependent methyltransferase
VRPSIRAFLEQVIDCVDVPGPVFEFGSFRAPGLEELADLRPLFPGKAFVGTDMRPGPGVDRVLDLHAIDLPDDSVGTALVLETLEHVRYPHRAMAELRRVLRPDGVLVASSVMSYPVHNAPSDYWRFTPDGFAALVEDFACAVTQANGPDRLPISVVTVAFGHAPEEAVIATLKERLALWAQTTEPRWKEVVRLSVPPALLIGQRRFRGVSGL